MCGLVGVASTTPLLDREWLSTARDRLTHRGPDDAGEWWADSGQVGLAHRRLSILDLSAAGHQPMHLTDGSFSIVFNGEIYNFKELRKELEQHGHTFASHGDTEVVLFAFRTWGIKCLSRLNGMFAFALFDRDKRQLFLVRDRAGEKPLFYYENKDTLYFSSELKALMANPALPKYVDPDALDCYLAMGFVPGNQCILKGFRKLPPAHVLRFDLNGGTTEVWQYWELPKEPNLINATSVGTKSSLVDELEALLENAVGKQLVADVPIGVLLSGGVDSSLITAMATRHSSNVQTFNVGFPGYGNLDETEHARLIAKHFGTEHLELVVESTTADLIPQLVQQFDEPIIDSSMIPTWLVSQLVCQHCTVVLGGDGGDELFGGYGHYNRLLKLKSWFGWSPLLVRRFLSMRAMSCLPVGFRGRNWARALDSDLSYDLPLLAIYFDKATREKLANITPDSVGVAERIFSERVPEISDLIQRATRTDFRNYMSEDILVKVDRASMMNSLEVRAPFLDYRIIEFAFERVPSSLKVCGNARKIILKSMCEKLLPSEFDLQRKQGFSIPLNEWLKEGPFREMFWSVLLDDHAFFDRAIVTDLLDKQDNGYRNGERLFGLVQFDLWRREYNVGF